MHTKRFKWFLGLAIVASLACLATPVFPEEKKTSDATVAIVNGTTITQADFDREIIQIQKQYADSGRPISELQYQNIKKNVLETLINRELLYQESQKKGVVIKDEIVDEQFNTLKKGFASEDEFKNVMASVKMSEADLKSQLKKGKAIEQLIDEKFVQKVEISENETKDFYKKNPDMFTQPGQVRARHILIKIDPKADETTKAAAREKLVEVQKKLQEGEDFEALAKEYSEGPSGAKGGDLGYFSKGQMVKPFEEVAFSLPPGKVSDIVETRFGYHIIKVVDKKPKSIISYDQAKDKLQKYLKQRKVQEKVNVYVEELKGKAKVESFLEENS